MKHYFTLIICLIFANSPLIAKQFKDIPRPEYPRPQFQREDWLNLNGEWSYEFDFGNSGKERGLKDSHGFKEKIIVPFCPESKLSGVGYQDFIENIWYHKRVTLPKQWNGKRIQLNFGGVDYVAEIYINGTFVGRHYGGSSSFSFNIANYITIEDSFDLVVHAEDYTRSGEQNLGKQSKEYQPKRTRYRRTTGIWQTVWVEPVSELGVEKCQIIPDLDQGKFDFIPAFYNLKQGNLLKITIKDKSKIVASKSFVPGSGQIYQIYIKDVKTWSPKDPFLYDIIYELILSNGITIDRIQTYAGMRKIHTEGNKFFLNNEPFYQRLVLDQGFYPEGIWTAPNDEALKNDIKLGMSAGFNGARLHQKVFEERYLL